MRTFFPTLLLALCFGPALPIAAQTRQIPISQMPAAARNLIAIKVTGNKRYSEADIAAASGLQLGTPVSEDDFKKAARRLGDTGAFTDVAFSYSYSPAGTKLEFKVSEINKFVPVRFEDFVWFSDADLLARIRQNVPLFTGELPLSGRMPDEISDVLQGMLVERSIPGHVEYERAGRSDGPIDSIVYRVADVLIQIADFEFPGAAESDVPALKAAAQRLINREYSRTTLIALVQKQLLPVYYARGYLKAAFATPEAKVVKEPSVQSDDTVRNMTVVNVIFHVTPAQQYKLKSIDWSGNKEIPTDTLQKMVRAEPGQPANLVRISDNLKDIQKLYGSRGYVSVTITPETTFDDAAGTVAILLNVKEGSEYHMGELEFRGLDNSLTAKLRNAWKLRPGDVYDSTYLSQYLPEAHKLLPPSLDWEAEPHVTANVRDKTVDVDIIYTVKAPK